jgi:hypothetical protein
MVMVMQYQPVRGVTLLTRNLLRLILAPRSEGNDGSHRAMHRNISCSTAARKSAWSGGR